MKGLIRNSFYSMEDNIKLAFLMSGALIFVPLLTAEASILSIIIAVQIFIFIANVGTALHADEVSKWNKFECTLPIGKNSIILAKYLSFSILILFGFAISILTGVLVLSKWPSMDMYDLIWGYEYGLTLSIIVASIMYPVMLKTGTEKNELIILIAAFIASMFMLVVALCLSPLTGGMNMRSPLVGTVTACISPLLLIISYFISLRIYKNKEY